MNCPRCSTPLLLLQEGKPPGPGSIRNFWVNDWACEKCDEVFPAECVFVKPSGRGFISPKTSKKAREKGLLDTIKDISRYRPYVKVTLNDYKNALKKNLSGDIRSDGAHLAWPSEGNQIYVPTENRLVIGGLATIETSNNGGPRMGWTKKASEFHRKHGVGYFICVEEHPGYEYTWEELAPMQEALEKEFGREPAKIILPASNALKPRDKIYIKNEYLWTEHYVNRGVTSEDYEYINFSDLPDDTLIPRITYNGGGIATVSRVSAGVDDSGREYYKFQTKERGEYSWYNWTKLAEEQEKLKEKYGARRASTQSAYHDNLYVRPAEYDKIFFELFEYMPRK